MLHAVLVHVLGHVGGGVAARMLAVLQGRLVGLDRLDRDRGRGCGLGGGRGGHKPP
jgi:hypothetical protein